MYVCIFNVCIYLYMYTWNPRDWRVWLGVLWPLKKTSFTIQNSGQWSSIMYIYSFIHVSIYIYIYLYLLNLFAYLFIYLFRYRASFSLYFHDISMASRKNGQSATKIYLASKSWSYSCAAVDRGDMSGKEKHGHVMAVSLW